jgi:hypothetical protein
MKSPFALSVNNALRKILETWGSRLTWTAHRQHTAQIIGDGRHCFHVPRSYHPIRWTSQARSRIWTPSP